MHLRMHSNKYDISRNVSVMIHPIAQTCAIHWRACHINCGGPLREYFTLLRTATKTWSVYATATGSYQHLVRNLWKHMAFHWSACGLA